jgi:hypothetical protein
MICDKRNRGNIEGRTSTMAKSLADIWAKQYGELLNKTQIAKMLGVSRQTVMRRANEGKYRTNADGKLIFTRSVAVYEETGIPQGTPTPEVAQIMQARAKSRFRIERNAL